MPAGPAVEGLGEVHHDCLAILIVGEDGLARIATRHHVIQRASELDAEGAGHAVRVRSRMWQNKT
jgi:hypothetical protein